MNKIYLMLLMVSLSFGAFAQERSALPQQEHVKVKFYPNPATSVINFEFTKSNPDATYTLQVFNFIGKKVAEVIVSNNKASLSLDNYFRGVYIFQLRDKTGRIIESGKFQVVKLFSFIWSAAVPPGIACCVTHLCGRNDFHLSVTSTTRNFR
jgi:hypothetical protein